MKQLIKAIDVCRIRISHLDRIGMSAVLDMNRGELFRLIQYIIPVKKQERDYMNDISLVVNEVYISTIE